MFELERGQQLLTIHGLEPTAIGWWEGCGEGGEFPTAIGIITTAAKCKAV